MRLRFLILLLPACLVVVSMSAQSKRLISEGNLLYSEKKYKDAAVAYEKALQKDPTNTTSMFNLGNSLYQQKQYDAARKVMDITAKSSKDKDAKAAANYNTGNSYMEERKWEDAVSSYKQALRNNPEDADAKYNLSYAQEMLKKQQDKNNKDKKDNKQDKKDQNKKDDKKDDKGDKKDDKGKDKKDEQNKDGQQDKNDKDQKDKQDQQPQSQPSKLSEKQAEQLLNALQQEEKKLQDKMQKAKGVPVKVEKDW